MFLSREVVTPSHRITQKFGNSSCYRLVYIPNKDSIGEFQREFNDIVAAEFGKGRYLGPLTRSELEEIIGPFQSSPFSIIPKTGRVGHYQILQNDSFPNQPTYAFPNPLINSYINSKEFPTFWGTFSVVSLLIMCLPPGSQAATRDVAEAYCTVQIHPSQWPAAIVWSDDNDYGLDTETCFGTTPSAGIYRQVHNGGADTIHSCGIGPIVPWVDDHVFFHICQQFLEDYNLQ
jgi:hypothetical protein